jgi:hypothetical protein
MHEIKKYLSYDKDTGLFTRIGRCAHDTRPLGGVAGSLHKKGYWVIKYKGVQYKAHRLAWYYTYGAMPMGVIDHENEIKMDNRICNLRDASHSQNQQNITAPRKTNTSGAKGVYWRGNRSCWVARIVVNRKCIHIGSYSSVLDAKAAYLAAKQVHHTFWVV